MAAKVVVIFVHGTWSKPQIWNGLEKHLQACLGERFSIVFESICWSGGNSATARLGGINRFEAVVQQYPDRCVVVICHSHGANIALGASAGVRARIALLICLNSPILTTIKGRLPWPIWASFGLFVVLSIAGAVGVFLGTTLGAGLYPALGLIAVVGLFWRIAITKGAFLVLFLFGLAMLSSPFLAWLEWTSPRTLADIAGVRPAEYQQMLDEARQMLNQSVVKVTMTEAELNDLVRAELIGHVRFLDVAQIAALLIVSGTLLLVPTLVLYALWSRRYAVSVNPQAVEGVTQMLSIDDEIFLLLGLALVIQRAMQFAMWPLERLFRVSAFAFVVFFPVSIVAEVVGRFFPSTAGLFSEYSAWMFTVFGILAALAALGGVLVFIRVLIFGVAYGWDMAGLSIDRAIYVSVGSCLQPTTVYTLQPETTQGIWISHPAIHDRPKTFELVTDLMKKAFDPDVRGS